MDLRKSVSLVEISIQNLKISALEFVLDRFSVSCFEG